MFFSLIPWCSARQKSSSSDYGYIVTQFRVTPTDRLDTRNIHTDTEHATAENVRPTGARNISEDVKGSGRDQDALFARCPPKA